MTPNRFCKDCKNYLGKTTGPGCLSSFESCRVAVVTFDPIAGEIRRPSNCITKNGDFNCPDWVPKNGERIAPGRSLVAEKKPWWRLW